MLTFQAVEQLYQYSLEANKTMKNVFFDAVETTKQCGNISYNCVKEKVLEFAAEKTKEVNQSEEELVEVVDTSKSINL